MSLSSTSRLVLVSDVPSFIFFVVWCLLSVPISSSGRGCVLIVLYVFGFWFRFRAWAFVSCRFVFFLWGRVCVSPGARLSLACRLRPGFGFVSLVGLCSYVLACLVRGFVFLVLPFPRWGFILLVSSVGGLFLVCFPPRHGGFMGTCDLSLGLGWVPRPFPRDA